jgi:hypothetical protein
MSSRRPNPPRRNWLAVWRWPKRAWVALAIIAMVGYPLSYPVAMHALYLAGTTDETDNTLILAVCDFYRPVEWCEENSAIVRDLFAWESRWIRWIFGPLK